jgi:hypothetical protein
MKTYGAVQVYNLALISTLMEVMASFTFHSLYAPDPPEWKLDVG